MEGFTYSSSWIALVFFIGYLCIIYEHGLKIHKSASALMMATVCWLICFITPSFAAEGFFSCALGQASEVCFFLIGALTIVQIMEAHHSFSLISRHITARRPLTLLWILGTIAFFLSSILDNLTTTVVLITLLQQLMPKGQARLILGGGIVIAANAGGTWTPIGDITTTMLWIGGQITALGVVEALFEPSVVCCASAFALLSYQLKGIQENIPPLDTYHKSAPANTQHSRLFLILGISSLLLIPLIKTLFGLPPVMCMLLSTSILWLTNDWIHRHSDTQAARTITVLKHIDLPSVLFFLGILLTVESLEIADLLEYLAEWMQNLLPNKQMIAFAMGLLSAVIDNVPLVAAIMKMYTLETDPTSSVFWHSIAYAAGTGGSILIIGSAAGVAFMGLEGVTFGWWLRRITLAAFFGYLAGFTVHLFLSGWTG